MRPFKVKPSIPALAQESQPSKVRVFAGWMCSYTRACTSVFRNQFFAAHPAVTSIFINPFVSRRFVAPRQFRSLRGCCWPSWLSSNRRLYLLGRRRWFCWFGRGRGSRYYFGGRPTFRFIKIGRAHV